MKRLCLLLLTVCVMVTSAHFKPLSFFASESLGVSQVAFEQWMCSEEATCVSMETDSVPSIASKLMKRLELFLVKVGSPGSFVNIFRKHREVQRFVMHLVKEHRHKPPTMASLRQSLVQYLDGSVKGWNGTYPYFAFLPTPELSPVPGAGPVVYSTKCFDSVSVTATLVNSSSLQVIFNLAGQKGILCTDDVVLVAAGGAVGFAAFYEAGVFTHYLNVTEVMNKPADAWYLTNEGLRVLTLPIGILDAVVSLIDTVTLMFGFASSPVSPATFQDNFQFLTTYIEAAPRMQPVSVLRTAGAQVAKSLDPSVIQSGDALLVLRPDGLDPMIGWGEGSTVGHSTIAVRWPNGSLTVCESTTLDAYWPTNGIQCHEWAEWVNLCIGAEMNIVLVPLAPKYRALFNSSAAINFFHANKGTDYGFSTFLWGWLDTISDNFPCVPPDYKKCLFPQTAELLGILIDRLFGDNHQNFFRQGLNHRAGTWVPGANKGVVELMQYTKTKLNMSFMDLYTMPEQDSWQYNTTIDGQNAIAKSMVCCVFVCNMWKAAGVFSEIGSELQCGEQTLWDLYSMNIFDETKMGKGRPQVCQVADPDNELCQIMGNFTLYLRPDLNTRTLYKHMGEKCASLGPNYVRAPGC